MSSSSSSLTPPKKGEPVMPRISARGLEAIAKNLNRIQQSSINTSRNMATSNAGEMNMSQNSLSEMINLNLNEKYSLASNYNRAGCVGGAVSISSSTSSANRPPLHSTVQQEINNSIETIDNYSSPSKSSPGSQIQQNTAMYYDEYKDEEEDTLGATAAAEKQVTKLFVGNLPIGTTLSELLPIFKRFGPVDEQLSAVKQRDHYAFINFYHRKDAQVALQEINNSLFQDRYLRVQFSHSKHHFKRSTCNLDTFLKNLDYFLLFFFG